MNEHGRLFPLGNARPAIRTFDRWTGVRRLLFARRRYNYNLDLCLRRGRNRQDSTSHDHRLKRPQEEDDAGLSGCKLTTLAHKINSAARRITCPLQRPDVTGVLPPHCSVCGDLWSTFHGRAEVSPWRPRWRFSRLGRRDAEDIGNGLMRSRPGSSRRA